MSDTTRLRGGVHSTVGRRCGQVRRGQVVAILGILLELESLWNFVFPVK